MDDRPAAPTHEPRCDHACMKRDGHEGPHWYGYVLGPDRSVLLSEVERLRRENHAGRTICREVAAIIEAGQLPAAETAILADLLWTVGYRGDDDG